jgi:hypothetical protein
LTPRNNVGYALASLGSFLLTMGFLMLFFYPSPVEPQGREPGVRYTARENFTYRVEQSFLLRNDFNTTIADLVYVSLPLNESKQTTKVLWSNLVPLRKIVDEDENPIYVYNVSLTGKSEVWLNVSLEVTVESYSLSMTDVPWPEPSEIIDSTKGKRYWAVDNRTYTSIVNKEISPYARDPISASQNIGSWILKRLKYEVMSRRGAERALLFEGGSLVLRGDCEEVADVFVTMARALGIRSRVVHGMLLVSYDERMWARWNGSDFETSDNWGGHAWPQVYVHPVGWVDVEMLEGMVVKVGDFSGRHIKYNFEERKFMGSTIDNYCITGYFDVLAMYFSFRRV